MPVPGEEIPLPGAVQIVVHGALGLRREITSSNPVPNSTGQRTIGAKFLLSM